MPSFLVKLKDGREFDVEADSPPTKEEILAFLSQSAFAPAAAPTDQPGRLGSFASSVGRGALSIVPGTIGGIGYATGSDTLTEAADTLEGGINRMLPVNPEYQDEFLMKAGSAIGQAGGMLATGGITGAAGKALAASRGLQAAQAAAKGTQLAQNVMLGTGVAQGVRGGGQAAEQYGMQGGTAYARALLGGAIEGASERYLFGLGTELAPIKKLLGDAAEKGVGGIVKAAGTEAGEEAVAQVGGNLATTALAPYGVQTPGAFAGAGEAALLGGVAGGALGGFNALLPSPTIEGEAMVPFEQDTLGIAAFQQDIEQIVQNPNPIVPLQQTVNKAAETSVAANVELLPATAAVIAAGGLTPAPAPALVAATPTDPAEIHRKRNAEAKTFMVYDSEGLVDRKATQEKRDAAAKAAGMTREAWEDEQAALGQKAKEDFFAALNEGDTLEWTDLNGRKGTGIVEIGLDGRKVVRNTTEESPAEGEAYGAQSGVFGQVADALKVTKAAPRKKRAGSPAPVEQPTPAPKETLDQVRARLRQRLSAEERATMEQNLAQMEDEGVLADVFAEERQRAAQREDAARRQQDLENERQRFEDQGILGDVFAEERQRATTREQQRQQPPVVKETVAPIQPVPAVEETVAPEEPTKAEYEALLEEDRVNQLKAFKEERASLIDLYGNRGEKHPSGRQLGALNPAAQRLAYVRSRIFELEAKNPKEKAEKPEMTPVPGVNPKGKEGLLYNVKFGSRKGQIGKAGGKWYVVEDGDIVTENHPTAVAARDLWAKIGEAPPVKKSKTNAKPLLSRSERRALEEAEKAASTPGIVPNVEIVVDEPGAAEVGLVMEKPQTQNPYRTKVSDTEDFDFLDRLGVTDPPKDAETIPAGPLPEGTFTFRVGPGYNGNPPSRYAITPDGKIYSDSNRTMTHGGASPWVLDYVVRGSRSDTSASTPANPPVQRDVTKPEQMTPEEYASKKTGRSERISDERITPKYTKTDTVWDNAIREHEELSVAAAEAGLPTLTENKPKRLRSPQEQVAFDTVRDQGNPDAGTPAMLEVNKEDHVQEVKFGLDAKLPVSKAAVDAYKITLPEGYVRQGDLYVFQPKETPTSPVAPTPGAGTLSSGQRDTSKPEQMTPEEVKQIWATAKEWAETPDTEIAQKYQTEFSASDAYMRAHPFAPENWREGQKKLLKGKAPQKQHELAIGKAFGGNQPVSKAAVDAYGIAIPEGYVQDGELYVYRPSGTVEAKPAPPAKPSTQSLADRLRAATSRAEAQEIVDSATHDQLKAAATELNYTPKGTKKEIASRLVASVGSRADAVAIRDAGRPAQPPAPPAKPAAEVETGVAGVPVELPDPATLTNAQINKEKAALTKKRDSITDRMIAADRGSEVSSETMKKTDPLSKEFQEVTRRFQDLSNEAEMRMGSRVYGDLPTDKSWKSYRRKKPEDFGSTNTVVTKEKKSRALPTFTPAPKEPFKPSAERFAQFYVDDGFPEATAAKNGAKLMEVIETGEWSDILRPDNVKSRAIWETWTGKKLPKGLAASKEAVADFLADYRAKTFTTPATELSDKELDAEILRIAEQGMKPTASQTLKDRALELSKEFQARRDMAKTQQEDSSIKKRRTEIARKALAFTGGRGTVGNLAGDSFAQMRADLLSEIEGKKVPKAKAGINALMKALYQEFGIPADTEAGMQKKLAQAFQDAVTEATPPAKPAAEVETPVAGVPTLEVRTGADAKTADVRLALHRADKHYTLWVSHKRADGTYTPYQYISILGQDFGAAYDKAVAKANSIAAGEKLNVAFEGQNVEGARASAKSVGVLDEALSKEALEDLSGGVPMGKQPVGFGKYSSLTVDEMVAKDIGYADWVANNASTGRGAKVAQYIRERNPAYIEWRDAKNVQDAAKEAAGQSERERIKAFEQRVTQKPTAKPLDTKNTTTDNKVVVKSTPKLSSRKAKDQIVDIVPAQDSPSYIPESLTKNMFPSQVSGANAVIDALEKTGAALNGDGAGVGKTRQILAVASHYAAQGKPVVIITENAAIGKPWEGAKGKTNPTLGGSMAKDGQAMGIEVKLMPDEGFTKPGIYISTYNRVTDAQIPEGAVIIFDESQGLVNVYDDADPNKELGQWQQKFRTILDKAEKTAFYSATPADKPHQMSYLYKVLGYDSPQDFLVDARKNGLTVKTTKFGKTETKKYDIPFSSVKRTMLFRWVNNLMKKAGLSSSFIKREISYEGTDTQFHDVQGTDASKNPWAEKFNDVVDELESHQRNGWRLLAPDSYLLYAAELTKIGEAVRMVKRELAAGRKAVLYFSRIKEQEIRGRQFLGFDPMDGTPMFSDVTVLGTIPSPVDLLRAELEKEGIGFTELHSKSGDTSATAQKKFAGNTDVLLASVESGGTGINLDDPTGKTPRTEVFMFAPYRGISTVQAMGRIWRASTVQDDSRPNRYVFLVASDIKQDAMRSAILAKKLQLMDASLGGTAVNRLPMSKVSYSPDQLVGMELPEEGVEVERIEADKTKELKPVNIEFKMSQKGNLWANANADLLEWYEAGGPERTGLNITVFQAKEDGKVIPGKWIALSEKQYAPEEFALPAENQETQAPTKDFGSTNTVVTKETKDQAVKSLRKKIGGQTNVGLDPSILKDAITIGAFYLEGGARSFADFSAKMIEDFGAGVQKYIRPAYEALRKRTDIDTAGMDAEEETTNEPTAKSTIDREDTGKIIPDQVSIQPAARPEASQDDGRKEAPSAVQPADRAEPETIPIANDPVDAQRVALGLPPIMRQTQEAYTFPQMWADAESAMAANPKRGETLVDELNDKPRTISALEDAILLRERVNRVNALDLAMVEFNNAPKGNNEQQRKAMDTAITSLTELDNALNVAGTEQGRSLNARKMLARQDYTLAKMITTLRAANDGNLSEADVAMVTRLQKQIAEAQAKLAEVESGQAARLAEAEKVAFEAGRQEVLQEIEDRAKADAAKIAEMQKRRAEHQAAKKEAATKPNKWAEIREAARARNAELRSNLYSDVVLVKAASMAVNDVIIGATYIAEGVTKLADWVTSMRGEGYNLSDKEMEQLFNESKAFDAGEELPAAETPLRTRKAKAPTIDKVKAIAADEEALDSRTIYEMVVEKMKARAEASQGAKLPEMSEADLTSVIREVTADVQAYFPDITEREIRDLFSGYGKILMPSQDELSRQIRQLSALGKLASAIEDAKAKIAPLKSGPQRDKATQAIRLQQKKLARELRMGGLEYAAGEGQLRSPLDAIKARLNNQINDLALEINQRQKIKKRPSVDYDRETEALVTLRDDLKRISDEVNKPAGPTLGETVAEEMKKIDKRILELQKLIAENKFKPKEDTLLHTAELDAKRDVRDGLNKTLQKMRKEAADKLRTQDDIDKEAITSAQESIAELEKKIAAKDVSRPQRRTPTETAEYQALIEKKKSLQQVLAKLRESIEGKRQMSDEQRIKAATKALDASIARMTGMITSGKFDVVKRTPKTPDTPELKAKREARNNLRKRILELRKMKRDAGIDPIAKQISTDKKRIQTRMKKLKERLDKGDFSKPVKKTRATDEELLKLQIEEEKLKEQWAKTVFERQLASRGPGKRLLDATQQTLNTARAILTSVDVSAVLRQGGFIVLGNPMRGFRNLAPMFKAFASDEFAKGEKFRLANRENYKNGLYQQSKLFLADTSRIDQMSKQEEAFMTRWLEKIPRALGGGVLRGSQRAYTVFLNRLRADSFDAMVGNLKKGSEPTPEETKAVADYINIATGRGDLGKFNQAGTMLNTVFFAPRLVASRFQILAGYPYFTASGRTKALVLREYAKFLAGAAVVYALGSLAQDDDDEPIETDPRSSDFLKIRFGDTRVDPLSGLIQATVLLSRLASGEKKQASGKIVPIRGADVPYGADDSFDVMGNFVRTKFSPIVGSAVNVVTGKNVVGEPTDVTEELKRMVIPMSFNEARETLEAQGVPEATALIMLQLLGMGVQTYTPGKK